MMLSVIIAWRKRDSRDVNRVEWYTVSRRKREPRAGDWWVDGNGRTHVLGVKDDEGRVTTGDVPL